MQSSSPICMRSRIRVRVTGTIALYAECTLLRKALSPSCVSCVSPKLSGGGARAAFGKNSGYEVAICSKRQ